MCDSLRVPYHVSADEFERLAADALESIPPDLRARMDADNLMITIQPDATEDDRGRGNRQRVLGYFQGTTESTFSQPDIPNESCCSNTTSSGGSRTREELVDQVHDTVLHEVAHYFGMNHNDIDRTRLRH